MGPIIIRKWTSDDDISQITALLHRAYGQLADLGFRYHATWQDDKVTLDRLSRGIAFIAEQDGKIVGTATLYLPPSQTGCEWYDRADVARFGQFGVEPELQGQGIGSLLLDKIEFTTLSHGISNLALDTAEGATHLVDLYSRRGFQYVCSADWEITNYQSIIMNKKLTRPTPSHSPTVAISSTD
jgi:GNAT superfamily N-acetyltransferase